MAKTVILSAPQAWGKTRNQQALQQEFGCTSTVDEWSPGQPLHPGALHLTNTHPSQIFALGRAKLVSRGWQP